MLSNEFAFNLQIVHSLKTPRHKNTPLLRYVPVNPYLNNGDSAGEIDYLNDIALPTVPEGALRLLQALCGDDLTSVKQLSVVLSATMSPSEGGVTILLTQHPQLLRDVFAKILGTSLYRPAPGKRALSFNLLAKRPCQFSLFLAQEQGVGAALIADPLPSDANLPLIKKLIMGTRIACKTPMFPTQWYQNKLHFLCITSDPNRASLLQLKLKASQIDLSLSKLLPDQNAALLTDEDLHWLRTTFLLHGLKLRTLQAADIPPVPQEKEPVRPTTKESIQAFLSQCCQYEESAFSSMASAYQAYRRYVSATQTGLPVLIGRNSFKASFERALNRQSGLKKIHYGRSRHPDNGASKTGRGNKASYGYKGLKLFDGYPTAVPGRQLEHQILLRDYLEEISRYQVQFDEIIEARLTAPTKESSG